MWVGGADLDYGLVVFIVVMVCKPSNGTCSTGDCSGPITNVGGLSPGAIAGIVIGLVRYIYISFLQGSSVLLSVSTASFWRALPL